MRIAYKIYPYKEPVLCVPAISSQTAQGCPGRHHCPEMTNPRLVLIFLACKDNRPIAHGLCARGQNRRVKESDRQHEPAPQSHCSSGHWLKPWLCHFVRLNLWIILFFMCIPILLVKFHKDTIPFFIFKCPIRRQKLRLFESISFIAG
jgi:hypothetical protein